MKERPDPRSMPFTDRVSVLDLLSASELAAVKLAEADPKLVLGDEYLDLDRLSKGVRRAIGPGSPTGPLLARKAIEPRTWNKILMQLPPPRFSVAGPRRE